MTKNELWQVIATVVGWRVILFGVAAIAPLVLPFQPAFPYADIFLIPTGLPAWVYSWANFDGVHQIVISTQGYKGVGLIQAFFPMFPLLVSVVNTIISPPVISGLIVANFFAVVFYCLWFAFLKQSFDAKVAWTGLIIFLLFPTSFFLGAFYSESFFLSLVLSAVLSGCHKKWWLAGILAAVASGTRVVGVVLVPMLFIMLLETYLKNPIHSSVAQWKTALTKVWQSHKKDLAWISLGITGLLAYMTYLFIEFKDPIYFFHVQSEFGGIRQESLVLYPQVLWRSLKVVLTLRPINLQYLTFVQEFLVGILGLAGILLAFRKVRWSYSFFSLAVFIIPTLTGTFSSLSRYVLASLALFIWLALVLRSRPWVLGIYLICSSLLLLINIVLFIQGYWVA